LPGVREGLRRAALRLLLVQLAARRVIGIDWDKVIPDPKKALAQGAIRAWSGKSSEWERNQLLKFAKKRKIPTDRPWEKLTRAQREEILEGEGTWEGGKFPGVRAWFKWLETRTYKMHVRVFLARYREYVACRACDGSRLNQVARSYRVAGLDLPGWHACTVHESLARLRAYPANTPQGQRAHAQLVSRLAYLERVGLGYLSLDRQARTLSGGEAQRAGLTTALGARLTGALFVLDEPTVGLHALDVPPLADAIRDLSSAGNSVIVVEHDATLVRACGRAVELGPGAGKHGGRVLFDGAPDELFIRADLPTGRAHERRRAVPARRATRSATGSLEVRGASENNLKGVDVELPLGVLCVVTGPSGSGKSTLVEDVVYRSVARSLGDTRVARPGVVKKVGGYSALSRAVLVDQSPLGRTARGNAATYTKAWDRLRARFAHEQDARRRGLTAAHFSFNVAGGRCDACAGEGYETVEMQFLADVQLLCPSCKGKRFLPHVLEAKLGGLTVAEVLELTVEETIARFCEGEFYDPVLKRALEPVRNVGLGYLPLGQPLSTFSGGEAQRLKLARALSEEPNRTLFVIDEPSAGLHAEDAAKVIDALHALVDRGASVIVVEHDLDVIAACDWICDLGPGGGPDGGAIVAQGTLNDLLAAEGRTAEALRAALGSSRKSRARPRVLRDSAVRAPSVPPCIHVEHAREHTLKEISCAIPHGKLCVVTGPSGSGKSSLAFDVVFAEGQRRFMETLSPYARQFLPTLPRPDVDDVIGVPPSIALEQRTSRAGANSTVATVTEAAHYLRLLYAKVGDLHCPQCDSIVAPRSSEELYRELTTRAAPKREEGRVTVYSPAVRARKGTYLDLFTNAARAGVRTARVDGRIVEIDPPPRLPKAHEHTIDLIVHYGPLADLDRASYERALAWGGGVLKIRRGPPSANDAGDEVVSTSRSCVNCGTGVPELDPRWFSFNTKQGQCAACEGTGIRGGAAALADDSTARVPCPACKGTRLSPVPRRVRLFGETYAEFLARSVQDAYIRTDRWAFSGKAAQIAETPLVELRRRLAFVNEVGLGYLALDRAAGTLSGGEMQRLRLSAQLGSGLTGALYVLDEPTIGLHPRDTARLIDNLRALTATGSTVLVVEHDADTIRAADHVIDMGPSGGTGGGRIMAEGSARDVLASAHAPTAAALREETRAARVVRPTARDHLLLRGATAHNLKSVDFRVPIGRFCVVCGVSGSGKSTLVRHVFYPALRRALGLVAPEPGPYRAFEGDEHVNRALAVDQSPIGRTPRSVPATFLGIWDDVRKLFARLPDAQVRGYAPGRFSFNAKSGGRCEACEGQGAIVHEMSFLPDVVSPCEACQGQRFEPATLDVRYADLSIGDVLRLSAEEAARVFAAHPRIARPLQTLCDLGVGYLQIGQGSNTLSGGEAQRLKLAAELTMGSIHEPTVYVLDEPTTGLHLSDVKRLVGVLHRLVDRGDTLVVIEHHPDVIASADWVVELGPDAGVRGGQIVFAGTPENLALARTETGKVLGSETNRATTRRSPLEPLSPA
jgi:excinuclease ABC subunit A